MSWGEKVLFFVALSPFDVWTHIAEHSVYYVVHTISSIFFAPFARVPEHFQCRFFIRIMLFEESLQPNISCFDAFDVAWMKSIWQKHRAKKRNDYWIMRWNQFGCRCVRINRYLIETIDNSYTQRSISSPIKSKSKHFFLEKVCSCEFFIKFPMYFDYLWEKWKFHSMKIQSLMKQKIAEASFFRNIGMFIIVVLPPRPNAVRIVICGFLLINELQIFEKSTTFQ